MKVALIEFFVKQNQMFVFVIDPQNPISDKEQPFVITIDIGVDDLQAIKSLIWGFGKPSVIVERNLEIFQELGSTIFQPILDYLNDCDVLYLVPHKELHNLPLHAIEIGGKPLCEQYAIVYLPNASLLKFCQDNNVLRKTKKYVFKQVLSLGVGAQNDTRHFQTKFKTEAMQVATSFGSTKSECFTGIKATKSAFMEHAHQSDLIHIASHGFFDALNPLGSGPLLAYRKRLPSQTVQPSKNHVLMAEEFYQLRLRTNLMVLSGCLTGRSEVRPGDELLGLVRGVFAAGVPAMIVSLWEAHHDATLEFMQIFYQALNLGAPKALALQTAQRELRQKQNFQHIKYWAPFILIGDWF